MNKSLLEMIIEADGQPKVLVLAGGGGSGKSFFISKLGLEDTDIPVINPDKYVEQDDLPLGPAAQKADKEAQELMKQGKSFIWDTTGQNPSKVQDLLSHGYDVRMVMIYTHPFISFISNFERTRKIPAQGVFNTWENAYSLISEYEKMLGDKFTLVTNIRPGYEKEVEAFNQAAKTGTLPEFLKSYTEKDPEKYRSTFRREFELPQAELEIFNGLLSQTDIPTSDESAIKELKKDFEKYAHLYEKQGPSRLVAKYETIKQRRKKQDQNYTNTLNNISNMLMKDKNLTKGISVDQGIEVAKAHF